MSRFKGKLIIFFVNFEIALRVVAYGTGLRRAFAHDYMTAVSAFPYLDFALFEHCGSFNVFQKGAISFFVLFLDFTDQTEFYGEIFKPFLFRGLCKFFRSEERRVGKECRL